jgi:hypothetical protein
VTREEHLLTIIAEESTEIAKCATKALRFGLTDTEPGKDENNATRMTLEYLDLIAVLEMLRDENPAFRLWHQRAKFGINEKIAAKREKVEKFLLYSKEQGTLNP